MWVRPPHPHGCQKRGKFHADSRRGIFFSFYPNMTRNIEYYNEETHQVKIASNFRFDEGFNDLPVDKLNPNVISLSYLNEGDPIPMEEN